MFFGGGPLNGSCRGSINGSSRGSPIFQSIAQLALQVSARKILRYNSPSDIRNHRLRIRFIERPLTTRRRRPKSHPCLVLLTRLSSCGCCMIMTTKKTPPLRFSSCCWPDVSWRFVGGRLCLSVVHIRAQSQKYPLPWIQGPRLSLNPLPWIRPYSYGSSRMIRLLVYTTTTARRRIQQKK
jgi:hypothetical protein